MRSVIRFNACIALIAAGLAALTLCAVFVPAFLAAGRANEEKRAARYDPAADGPVLRLHIVANSDSQEDQRIKLAVRDALTAFERDETELLTSADAKAAEALIMRNGAAVLEAVRAELTRQGAPYGAQLLIGDFDFPDREYGGVLYPAGRYRALRVLLGSAEGENWWCILFPPLCVIRPAPTAAPAATEPPKPQSFFLRLFRLITKGRTE